MHSQILEHLGEPEALGVVNEVVVVVGLVRVADIPDAPKAGRCAQVRLEALDGRCGAIEVLGVAGHTERIEVRLENLGAEVVVGGALIDEEAMLVEKGSAAGRELLSREVAFVGEEREGLRTNPGARLSLVSR